MVDPMATGDRQSESAYKAIREMVRRRELTPGEIVSENQLAKQLGVGRTPVREAVLRLGYEGLFVMLPKRGILVRSMSVRDISEMYEVRSRLETLAAARAAAPGRMTSAALDRLRELVREQIEEGSSDVPDAIRLRRLDREFHIEIWKQAGNERLRAMLLSLLDAAELDPLWDQIMIVRRWNSSVIEHHAIVDALEAGDPAAAEAAMLEHNRSYQRLIVQYLSEGTGARELAVAAPPSDPDPL
jgi:DNA-binding GntR family transcriptional regulator